MTAKRDTESAVEGKNRQQPERLPSLMLPARGETKKGTAWFGEWTNDCEIERRRRGRKKRRERNEERGEMEEQGGIESTETNLRLPRGKRDRHTFWREERVSVVVEESLEGRLRREKERNHTSESDRSAERKLATATPDADGEVALGDSPSAKDGTVVGEILVPQFEGDGRTRSGREGGFLEATKLADGHLARSRVGEGDVELRIRTGQYEKGGSGEQERGRT
jgi:hypothetical protein